MDLQIRKMRAELNVSLQSRTTVADIKADAAAFESKYGPSIWGCQCQRGETFADVYNAHLQRETENEESREETRHRAEGILREIDESDVKGWRRCKWFVYRVPALLDRQDVLDALEERRIYLEIPEED
jgi:hypothetical protein